MALKDRDEVASPVMHVRHTGPGNQCNDARSTEVPEFLPYEKEFLSGGLN